MKRAHTNGSLKKKKGGGGLGTVAPLLSADLWCSDDTVHTVMVSERKCVCVCGYVWVGGLSVRVLVCVCVQCFPDTPHQSLRHPTVSCEAQTGAQLTP